MAKRKVKSVDWYWTDRYQPTKKWHCPNGPNLPSRTIVGSRDRDDVGDDD